VNPEPDRGSTKSDWVQHLLKRLRPNPMPSVLRPIAPSRMSVEPTRGPNTPYQVELRLAGSRTNCERKADRSVARPERNRQRLDRNVPKGKNDVLDAKRNKTWGTRNAPESSETPPSR
jgi:hypothetical protein